MALFPGLDGRTAALLPPSFDAARYIMGGVFGRTTLKGNLALPATLPASLIPDLCIDGGYRGVESVSMALRVLL